MEIKLKNNGIGKIRSINIINNEWKLNLINKY